MTDEQHPSDSPNDPTIPSRPHPEYVYCILQGAGIIKIGRPISGNFYCYKIPIAQEPLLRELMDSKPIDGGTAELGVFIRRYQVAWSHYVAEDGSEAAGRHWKT